MLKDIRVSKIRTGDEVVVTAGRDKGRRGKVVARVGTDRFAVEGVNQVKKHTKPNPAKGVTGGVADKIQSIHCSNVAIFNAATGKPDRVVMKTVGDKKSRVFRSSGEEIKA
jgi:large subunit ribosomal protein L24